ncbi:unnamed protein product [Ambrosiozyma monospora]|uniref:Unnamed protein product n=1 Tax=Ambrosiozyma monospora TaxID=43982 RepID=A0ACB5T9X5_AMBMO|nr:unnamed protein product [Ambrosiozyma monospora]
MSSEPIAKSKEVKETVIKEPVSIDQKLNEFLSLIQKSAADFDPRYILKVFRELTPVRREITATSLKNIVESTYPADNLSKEYILKTLSPFVAADADVMDTSEDVVSDGASTESIELTPEVDIFIHLLIQIFLHDKKETKKLDTFNGYAYRALKSYNRRTLDYLQAKVWFYIFRAKELLKDLIPIRADLFL